MDLKVTRACYNYERLMRRFINLCTFDYLEIVHLCYFQEKKSVSKRKQYTLVLLEHFCARSYQCFYFIFSARALHCILFPPFSPGLLSHPSEKSSDLLSDGGASHPQRTHQQTTHNSELIQCIIVFSFILWQFSNFSHDLVVIFEARLLLVKGER